MAEEFLAGVGLRITQLGFLSNGGRNDLVMFNASEYPNGALVFVHANRTLYALDKQSALTADGITVVAASGGGRWIAQLGQSAALYTGMVRWTVLAGSATPALVQSTWSPLPSDVNNFVAPAGTSGLWSVNTSSGLMSYSGPTRDFLVYGNLTASAAAGTTTNFGFSFNLGAASIIGTTTDQQCEAQVEFAATEEQSISFVGILNDLPSGSTVQGTVRNLDGTEALTVLRYSLVIVPAL